MRGNSCRQSFFVKTKHTYNALSIKVLTIYHKPHRKMSRFTLSFVPSYAAFGDLSDNHGLSPTGMSAFLIENKYNGCSTKPAAV